MKYIQFLLLHMFCLTAASGYEEKLLQTFASILDNSTVSQSCQDALQQYIQNLQEETDQWAMQMLDATSKIPVGLLSYNFGELGQFDQCLETVSKNGLIKPKYCLGTIPVSVNTTEIHIENWPQSRLERALNIRKHSRTLAGVTTYDKDNITTFEASMGITWALCLPDACSNADVTGIFDELLGTTNVLCQTNEDLSPPLTNGAIATIAVFAFFAFLLIASTSLDLFYTYYKKSEAPHMVLTAFSVYSNGAKLFQISKNSNELTCLNGMRFYSMMWVIAGHVFSRASVDPVVNFKNVMEWLDTSRSMIIASGILSVDTFFTMTGALVVYGYFKSKHQGKKFNIFHFYIHRYLRLTPPLAAGVLMSAHLLKYMGTGPKWSFINGFEEPCRKYWWTSLLYIQNYAEQNHTICIPHTWYLNIDMQLYIISPLVLIPLWKYPKIGVGLVIAAIVTFLIVPFFVAYSNELVGFLPKLLLTNSDNYMVIYYIKTHTRAAPWFIGALLGYILAKIRFQGQYQHLILNKFLVIFLWMASIAVGATCIFGGRSTLMVTEYDIWANSFYIALVKPAWSISLAWIIFACVNGYGGPVNWLLSLPIYQVLNRFTYSMYLLHYTLIYMFSYSLRTGVYFSELTVVYSFWGVAMFSFGLSVIWVLAFESPIVVFEKILFDSSNHKNKSKQNWQ